MKQVGKVYEEKILTNFEKNYRENLDMNNFTLIEGQGICTGPAGSGKTHKLIKHLIKEENPLVLSFTNKAVQLSG